ncbi:MAG: ABC transporter substrate-binding protein, partial [Thiotrichaceae bacterium]
YKVEVLPLPKEVLSELKRLTKEALAEEAAKDADFKRVYETFAKFQQENNAWAAISDDAYSEALKD